jgi:hypothetical protein
MGREIWLPEKAVQGAGSAESFFIMRNEARQDGNFHLAGRSHSHCKGNEATI